MMVNFSKSLYSYLFDAADRLNRRNILGAITTFARTVKSQAILDIGCDDGRWTEKLVAAAAEGNSAQRIIRVVGIEIFEKQAQLAETRGIQVYRADVSNGLPCESSSFDIVHANQVIEHLPQIDIFVSEILRVLKPNGLMIISSENASAWHNIFAAVMGWQIFSLTNVSDRVGALGNPFALHRGTDAFASSWTHKTIFNYQGFKELFEVHGFQDVTVMGAGYHPLPPIFGKLDPRHAHFITAIGRKPISSIYNNEISSSKIEKISGYIE